MFFLIQDTQRTAIYTLSLHDALPICLTSHAKRRFQRRLRASSSQRISKTLSEMQYRLEETATRWPASRVELHRRTMASRSEEHTSELQSHVNLVCRLLLEKKNKKILQ